MNIHADFQDLRDLILGYQIGRGVYRTVYVFRPDPSLVVKVSEGDPSSNIIEYRIWEELGGTPYGKWLAPCVAISRCGLYLLQKRVEYRGKDQYPKRVPQFLNNDVKYQNFGWIGNQFVCCDYGGLRIAGGFPWSLKKAGWWSAD